MAISREKGPGTSRRVILVTVLFSILAVPCLVLSQTESRPVDDGVEKRWFKIRGHLDYAEYDSVITEATAIIQEYSDSRTLRRAYNLKVWAFHRKGAVDEAFLVAEEALKRFPDIEVSDTRIGGKVNYYYEEKRRQMFGSLAVIVKKPAESHVFLDSTYVGLSPLDSSLVRRGIHELKLSKSGYHDFVGRISINPDEKLVKELSLDPMRPKWWWVPPAGVGLVVVGIVAYVILSGGDEDSGGSTSGTFGQPPPPP